MGLFGKLKAYSRVMRARKRPLDHVRLLWRRPALLLGVNTFEMAQLLCGRVESRLKALAQIKTSALIGCPF
jgi:hypothetical protein